MKRICIGYMITMLGALAGATVGATASSEAIDDDERMEWFHDAKFGMFIHFGAETPERPRDSDLTRTEKYEIAVREFNPVDFDAKEWVSIAKAAGMKYIVFTTKHHDGFCKWDSAFTEWDVVDQTQFKRDLIGELAEACHAEGIRICFYYSIADWHHPEYDPDYSNRNGFHFNPNLDADISEYMVYMYDQIEELCKKYKPSMFWFDGSAGFRRQERKRLLGQQEMVDLLHSYGAISNSRLGDDDSLKFVDFLSMGDNMIPGGQIGVPFESAGTMNESWHFDEADDDWKSSKGLLSRLVDIAGKGGNYLLNVGPTRVGVIPEESVTRLKSMGDWLEKNGEAIYGTGAGPYPFELGWGSITQRKAGDDTVLYLNIVEWPVNGSLSLHGLDNAILNAELLVGGRSVPVSTEFDVNTGLNVHSFDLPKESPDPYVSVIKVTVAGVARMQTIPMQQNNGVVDLNAYRARIHEKKQVPNKLLHAIDYKMFTVTQKGEGIMPGRGLTVSGLNRPGQYLTWDFKLFEAGVYDVAVVSLVNHLAPWKSDGRMRVTVAGKSVEGELVEQKRMENQRMPKKLNDSLAVLGTVVIDTPGTYTLTLEVTEEFVKNPPSVRSVRLLPAEK
ncbi:alpha-L-fucosidase [Puniceicoccaceae bacterium K14]|nr:alpha-L-fucosidase [Puniceicoccaceae bacterium K14]